MKVASSAPRCDCDCPFRVSMMGKGISSATELDCMLGDVIQHIEFEPGDVIFMQGQPSAHVYVVTKGIVKLCTHCPEGREQIVGLCSPERALAGLQSLNDKHYAYSAIATAKVRVCKISHRTLLACIHDDGDLAVRLVKAVSEQLAHSRALTEVLGHTCAAAKIASFILLMIPKSEHGNCGFPLPFSRMEMASLLGLREETVCRIMADMHRHGAIDAPRGRMEIHAWDQLHDIADGKSKGQVVA